MMYGLPAVVVNTVLNLSLSLKIIKSFKNIDWTVGISIDASHFKKVNCESDLEMKTCQIPFQPCSQFQVILDVQQFTPEEITVKASHNSVLVEGKHEEKQDEHGYISRQFTRRYILPSGYEVADLVSSLSSDGVLTITAPKRPPPQAGERIVPITKTGPAKQPEPPKPEQPREQTVPIVTSP